MNSESISMRQLQIVLFVGMFSPVVRVLPRVCAQICSNSAWAAPLAAIVPAAAFPVICWSLLRYEGNRKGLADVLTEELGGVAGRIIIIFFFAFQVYYAGYIIRNSVERIISTVYPDSPVWIFAIVLTGVCCAVAMGKLRYLARTAEIFIILMAGTLAVITLFSAGNIKMENLLPVTVRDTGKIVKGAALVTNLLSIGIYTVFLAEDITCEKKDKRILIKYSIIMCVVAFIFVTLTVGTYGALVAEKTQQPFFIIIRDLKIFDIFERIEAVVMAVWVVTDFVLVSLELMISAELLKKILGFERRKFLVLPSASAAFTVSLIISDNAFSLWEITTDVLPRLNAVFTVILIPLFLVCRIIRKKVFKKVLTK